MSQTRTICKCRIIDIYTIIIRQSKRRQPRTTHESFDSDFFNRGRYLNRSKSCTLKKSLIFNPLQCIRQHNGFQLAFPSKGSFLYSSDFICHRVIGDVWRDLNMLHTILFKTTLPKYYRVAFTNIILYAIHLKVPNFLCTTNAGNYQASEK